MTTIALMGAGGKMGRRIADNLRERGEYRLLCVETGEAGLAALAERGFAPTDQAEALAVADIVVMALPDRLLGRVALTIVPSVRAGTLIVLLDPAAAAAGEMPARADIGYFVTHPCHPPLFGDEEGEARRDYFGGVLAKQAIVCALVQGHESDYARGEALARAMFAPVTRAHRVTVEQMALLEPAMAETVTAACATVIREAMDEAVRRGVPPEAARDFMMGHVQIPLSIVFGEIASPFSDGAKLIIRYGLDRVFRADWKRVFEPESVREQVTAIVRGEIPAE
jgi:hypothetical protein